MWHNDTYHTYQDQYVQHWHVPMCGISLSQAASSNTSNICSRCCLLPVRHFSCISSATWILPVGFLSQIRLSLASFAAWVLGGGRALGPVLSSSESFDAGVAAFWVCFGFAALLAAVHVLLVWLVLLGKRSWLLAGLLVVSAGPETWACNSANCFCILAPAYGGL